LRRDNVMQPLPRQLPELPEIGYPEAFYARRVKQADLVGDTHTREAYKVAQYVTLALAPHVEWQDKLRYFRHALRRHCAPPPLPSDDVWMFYQRLADLVRVHAGNEALKLAVKEDEIYANRLSIGSTRERIRPEAVRFFDNLLGTGESCPEHFSQEDWEQLRMIRAQWV
jgi:hypothetical protein